MKLFVLFATRECSRNIYGVIWKLSIGNSSLVSLTCKNTSFIYPKRNPNLLKSAQYVIKISPKVTSLLIIETYISWNTNVRLLLILSYCRCTPEKCTTKNKKQEKDCETCTERLAGKGSMSYKSALTNSEILGRVCCHLQKKKWLNKWMKKINLIPAAPRFWRTKSS